MMGEYQRADCASNRRTPLAARNVVLRFTMLAVIFAGCVIPRVAVGQDVRIRIETLDQGTLEGDLSTLTIGSEWEIKADSGFTTIRADSISAVTVLHDSDQAVAPAGEQSAGRICVFHLADGGMIKGRLLSGGLRSVHIGVDFVGYGKGPEIKIPYDGLSAIKFASVDDAPAEAEMVARMARREPARDLLIVPMGDKPVVLPGALESLGLDGWEFRLPTRLQRAPLDKAYGVVFGVGPTPPSAKSARVWLRSGDNFTADIVWANEGLLNLKTAAFGDHFIPWLVVARIDLQSRRVTALSELTPTAQTGGSALGVEWPMQKDRNVVGGPLRLAGRTIARGLGVHGGTTLVYTLDGGYEKFVATVGIDDAIGRRGSVVFRVLGDGKELFKTDVLRGGMPPVAVNVDVAGVKKLELFADPADGLDIGDHADWGEARLIRQAEAATTKAAK